MICCKVEIRWSYQTKSHETAHVRGICLITPNIESFDWFNRIISIIYLVSQQLIIQCEVCSVLFKYQTNRNISRTKSEFEKLWMELLYHLKSSFK